MREPQLAARGTAGRSGRRACGPRARGRSPRCGRTVEHGREVREQDRQRRVLMQPRLAATGTRIDTRDPHVPPAHVDRAALVEQQGRGLEAAQLDRLREGVAADGEVVVAEDRVAARQLPHERAQLRLAARPRHEVAREAHEVGVALARPRHGSLHGPRPARRQTQVEVGEMRRSRRPSSSAGSPATSTSSVRSRTQPASYQPQASPARAIAPRTTAIQIGLRLRAARWRA